MQRLFKHLLPAIIMATGFCTTAQALPVITLSDAGLVNSSVASVTTIDFNQGCGYSSCSGDFILANGSQSGLYAQPFGVNSQYLSVPNPSVTTQSATFGLGTAANYFGLFWGSIDSYNSISFYLNNLLVANYSGSDIVGQFADGNQINYSSNRYINFDFAGSTFDTVTLTSTGFAFESDNHTFKQVTAVSEPGAILLFMLGLVGLGLARRKVNAH